VDNEDRHTRSAIDGIFSVGGSGSDLAAWRSRLG